MFFQEIPIANIYVGPQVRQHFDPLYISQLADSMRDVGVLQPILVRYDKREYDGAEWIIVAGERRYHAALEAELSEVPCVITDADANQSREMSFAENFQRRDLTAEEEATVVREYLEQGLNKTRIGKTLHKSAGWVENRYQYLATGADVRDVGTRVPKKMSHLVLTDKVKAPGLRNSLLRRIERDDISFREVEAEVKKYQDEKAISDKAAENARKQSQAPDAETERQRNNFLRDERDAIIRSRQMVGPTPAPMARQSTATPTAWTAPIKTQADQGADLFPIDAPLETLELPVAVIPEPEPETPAQIESRAERRQAIAEANAEVTRAVAALEAFLTLCDDETHAAATQFARRIIKGDLTR